MTVTPDAVLRHFQSSARNAGLAVTQTTIAGRATVVGRTSQFRWRWVATRLHTFIFVSIFDSTGITPSELDQVMRQATDYAIANKGGLPRGLQTGTASVMVAVTESPAPTLSEWALTPHGHRYAAIAYPVLVTTSIPRVEQPTRMLLGRIYATYLRNLVREHVSTAFHNEA